MSPVPGPSLIPLKPVAESAYCLNQTTGITELGSEPLHMHVHSASLDIRLSLPYRFQQLRASLDSTPPLDKREEQLVLGCSQGQFLACNTRPVRRTVDRDRPCCQCRACA